MQQRTFNSIKRKFNNIFRKLEKLLKFFAPLQPVTGIYISKETGNSFHKTLKALDLSKESGGILLGYNKGNGILHITNVLICENTSLNKESEFMPSYDEYIRQVIKLFKTGKGRVKYIGEWHTHPFGITSPSFSDNKNMRYRSMICGEVILMIVTEGGKRNEFEGNISFYKKGSKENKSLKIKITEQ